MWADNRRVYTQRDCRDQGPLLLKGRSMLFICPPDQQRYGKNGICNKATINLIVLKMIMIKMCHFPILKERQIYAVYLSESAGI